VQAAWERAVRLYRTWTGSRVYTRVLTETARLLHLPADRIERGRRGGFSRQEDVHLRQCSQCRRAAECLITAVANPEDLAAVPAEGCWGAGPWQMSPVGVAEIRAPLRYLVFDSAKHSEAYWGRAEKAVAPGDREEKELFDAEGPRRLQSWISRDRRVEVNPTLLRDALVVSATSDAPGLFCWTAPGEGDRKLSRFTLVTRKLDQRFAGECRFLRSELDALVSIRGVGRLPLEFRYPSVKVIDGPGLAWLDGKDREEILKDIAERDWDDATLRSWEEWVSEAKASLDFGIAQASLGLNRSAAAELACRARCPPAHPAAIQ
jgi:hypothetical protein